jgi:hypothetical protein
MSPVGYANDIAFPVEAIRSKLLGGIPPEHIFHYTSMHSVENIIESRCLWATCVSDMADNREIHHGADILGQETAQLIKSEPAHVQQVLQGLPAYMRTRMKDTFLACFCGNATSEFHWDRYGPYCLTIPSDRSRCPLLRATSEADVSYQRVIYDEATQRSALRGALERTRDAARAHVAGEPSGPWAPWFIRFLTRIAAEVMLDLIVALKDPRYVMDEEWRIVVRPRRNLLSSAPDWEDDKFRVSIKPHPRRHVPLFIPQQLRPFYPLLRPPIPFAAVTQGSSAGTEDGLARIRRLLDENGRPDIPVRKREGCSTP